MQERLSLVCLIALLVAGAACLPSFALADDAWEARLLRRLDRLEERVDAIAAGAATAGTTTERVRALEGRIAALEAQAGTKTNQEAYIESDDEKRRLMSLTKALLSLERRLRRLTRAPPPEETPSPEGTPSPQGDRQPAGAAPAQDSPGRLRAERTAKAILRSSAPVLRTLAPQVARLGEDDVRLLLLALRERVSAGDRPPQEEEKESAKGPSLWERKRTREMIALLESSEFEVLLEVIKEFFIEPDLRATDALLALLLRTEHSALRGWINFTLGRARAVDALPTLLDLLMHEDDYTWSTAEIAIEEIIGQTSPVSFTAHTRAHQVAAQKFHGEWFRRNEAALRRELGQPKRTGPTAAGQSQIGPHDSVASELAKRILVAPTAISADTVLAVGNLNSDAVLELLRALRSCAARMVNGELLPMYLLPSQLPMKTRVRLWGTRIESETVAVAVQAAAELGDLGGSLAVSYLMRAIEAWKSDPDWSVPWQAMASLTKVRAADALEAVPLLIERMGDSHDSLRRLAYQVVVEITGHKFKFDPSGPSREREVAQRNCRQWFKNHEARLRRLLKNKK